ncbi:MAG TPA: endonuclease/exonuclease/phosphatase family protein [Bacteroidales bacterium]|nr:endonuclease/exonuclease/phosphatase family protein [Bacteroidales bacterium]
MWLGGEADHHNIEKSLEVIRVSGAEIIGLQEAYGYNEDGSNHDNGKIIAEKLGWNYIDQGGYGMMSRFPVVGISPTQKGVKLKIDENKFVWFFNCHLNYIPYQPYQLASKEYGDYPFISTEKEAVAWADSARGDVVREYVSEIQNITDEGWPVFLTGDFNEPSFLDWTDEAVKKGIYNLKVTWPSSAAFAKIGMKDAFRESYPDVEKYPGKTWSAIDYPGEIHDRIDFVFFKGKQVKVLNVNTIGFNDGISNIGIEDYPSDHRAVYALFQW